MSTLRTSLSLSLPAWFDPHALPRHFESPEDRMRLAIALAWRNVREGTGGPFGAAIFSREDHTLVAAGVNLVVPQHAPIAHAEIMAIALAGQSLASHDLSSCELVTSVAPCAMCLGAVVWSGVRSLVIGARGSDAERVGFDEGHKPADWRADLVRRGLHVTEDLLRDDAVAVLEEYRTSGGVIYNG